MSEQDNNRKRGRPQKYEGHHWYEWQACLDCGIERWVRMDMRAKRCRKCSALNNASHRQVTYYNKIKVGKYFAIKLPPSDFFYPMAWAKGCVLEHRLIMAKHLGRCLQLWEIVHHKNHIKDDNRIENLQLVSDDRHKQITLLENRIEQLEQRLTLLEAENVILKSQGVLT